MFTRVISRSSRAGILSPVFRYSSYPSSSVSIESRNLEEPELATKTRQDRIGGEKRFGMVAAAFASLNSESNKTQILTPGTDKKINQASSVNELLSVSEGSGVSRRHALQVVSMLAEWSSSGKVNLSDFENDPRFLRLCRVLTKNTSMPKQRNIVDMSKSEDLSMVLNVTADDEAAKLIGSISLSQMVKIMSTLAVRKRRSVLLLRALSYNMTKSHEKLNVKQSSDMLYSMAILNFPDENLLAKISEDICVELNKKIEKSSVIGSILTSIGHLRYKNPELLDALSEWVVKNHTMCRPQDMFSLCLTLAVVNYMPCNSEKLFQVLLPQLTPSEAGKPSLWLDIVWSLVLLDKASPEQISTILTGNYLEKLEDQDSIPSKLKLLNIDAAAGSLVKGYNGPRLPKDSNIRKTNLLSSKDKSEMIDSVLITLNNLIQSEKLLKTRINTGMGFSIDAMCLLDEKCSPLPLDTKRSSQKTYRIAVMTHSYHDMCRGKLEPTGVNVLARRILETQGYTVLPVPYTEFRLKDKLIQRVKYLETKLKEVVKGT